MKANESQATSGRARTARSYGALLLLASCAAPAREPAPSAARPADASAAPAAASIWQEVPGTGYRFELVPIPGDPAHGIAPFYLARTELTWDAFDAWIYTGGGLTFDEDEEPASQPASGAPADAITRPTKPYLPPDRGMGHDGFAAISLSYKNAAEFCRWLSQHSGRAFRLPTEAEWEHACRAGSSEAYSFGAEVAQLGEYAWYRENSGGKAHPVATRKPNAWGLFDMHGNAKEWCQGADGKPVTRGGGWRDAAELLRCDARVAQLPAWNASDPQVPKSPWWLSDGPFVGFRVLLEAP